MAETSDRKLEARVVALEFFVSELMGDIIASTPDPKATVGNVVRLTTERLEAVKHLAAESAEPGADEWAGQIADATFAICHLTVKAAERVVIGRAMANVPAAGSS
jgi:hypothetical protein